jgi:hypothetical protein
MKPEPSRDGMSQHALDINIPMILSYELDCSEPNCPEGIDDLALSYYGHPSQDVSSYESFVEKITQRTMKLAKSKTEYYAPERVDVANPERLHQVISSRPLRVYTVHNYNLDRSVFTKFDINSGWLKELTLGHLLYLYTLAYQEIYSRREADSPKLWGSIDDLAYNGDLSISAFIDADGVSAMYCCFHTHLKCY